MKQSHSVDLIWQLAAREVAAGQFREIEPEHFCLALLKFAELPAEAFEVADDHAEVARTVAVDAELVREELQKYQIESTSARRRLRNNLGKGDASHQDGNIHRSAATRALFEIASALAAESDCGTLTPVHLLAALVQSPTPAIAQVVLGKVPPSLAPVALRLLGKHGKDLLKEAAEGRLRAESNVEASSTAVLRILLKQERKSILLVTERNDLAQGVAIAIAGTIAGKEPRPEFRGRRLIDIAAPSRLSEFNGMRPSVEEKEAHLGLLRGLLSEAARHPEIMLFVPPIDVVSKSAGNSQWTSLLRETLEKGKVQFMCRVAPKIFTKHLRKDVVWKRQTEAVWLQSAAVSSVPREL